MKTLPSVIGCEWEGKRSVLERVAFRFRSKGCIGVWWVRKEMGEWMGEERGKDNAPDTEQIYRLRNFAQISTWPKGSLQRKYI